MQPSFIRCPLLATAADYRSGRVWATADRRRIVRLTWQRPIGSQPAMRVAHLAVCVLLLNACSDDKAASVADTTVPDSMGDTSGDTVGGETTVGPDATVPDTTVPDAPEPDTSVPDAPEPDTRETDTAACEYLDERELITCGQANVQILHWKDFGPAGCAPYYTRGADRYETIEALATAEGCDATCVYVARQAVSFIRCDGLGRSGWETHNADGEGCLEALYSTSDGIFADLCLWAQYACYCEG